MTLTRAMWTHGHAIRIEHPDRLSSVWRAGFFVRLIGKPTQNVWVHYAIPTPVIVTDNRLSADSVMIRYRTVPENDAWIDAVHAYDGERKIASHDDLSQQSADWSFSRYGIPNTPEVRWGIGISINIRFTHVSFTDMPLEDFAEPRVDTGGWEPEPLWGGGGSSGEAPAEETTPRQPQWHYGIEISSVGCDFGP